MKKIITLCMFFNFLATAQSYSWEELSVKAQALTELSLCFENALYERRNISMCDEHIVGAILAGVTKELIINDLRSIVQLHNLALQSANEVQKDLEKVVEDILSSESTQLLLMHRSI